MFLQNALDFMNGNEELCEMRTKTLSLNVLKVTQGGIVTFAKFFNSVGLAILVAFAGFIVALKRNKHRKEIRLRYDADDVREVGYEK